MKKVISIIIVAVVVFACSRNTDTLGPSLTDKFGPFNVFEAFQSSRTNVDFSKGERVEFTIVFSKQVNWEVHIVGQESGAEKVLKGFTNTIDATNGGSWDGTTTNLPMFKEEQCMAYVYVDDVDTTFSDTISSFIRVDGLRVTDAFIVTDFNNGLNPGFNRFVQSGANMRFDTVTDPKSPEGSAYYEFSGEVTFADDLGNITMPKSSFTDTNFTLNTNDEVVYFNVFAKKGPDAVKDIFVIQFMEDDNDNGIYDPNADDYYEYVFQGLTEDWDQRSILYSDLAPANSSGGGIKNPDKLIQLVVLPIGAKTPFQGFLDYMVFTENGPLQP